MKASSRRLGMSGWREPWSSTRSPDQARVLVPACASCASAPPARSMPPVTKKTSLSAASLLPVTKEPSLQR